jgi:hypothetical protein
MLVTFVVAVNNREILDSHFLSSPCFRGPHQHQILLQEGYCSAAKAYNNGIDHSHNDLVVFVHQDVILGPTWMADLKRALTYLDKHDPEWGVLGVCGVVQPDVGRGYVYSSGIGIIGSPFETPARIRTLDEIVLILRKSSNLSFDEGLPHFHMYGTDICLTAERDGKNNYVISAFCIHNTQPYLVLPREFYEGYRYVRRKWMKYLPIKTTCIQISRSNYRMYKRKLEDLYFRYVRRRLYYGSRAANVPQLLEKVETLQRQRFSLEHIAPSHER